MKTQNTDKETLKLLKPFLRSKNLKTVPEWQKHPQKNGEYVYATNGITAARVKAVLETPCELETSQGNLNLLELGFERLNRIGVLLKSKIDQPILHEKDSVININGTCFNSKLIKVLLNYSESATVYESTLVGKYSENPYIFDFGNIEIIILPIRCEKQWCTHIRFKLEN